MLPSINAIAGELWAMEPAALEAFVSAVGAINPEVAAKLSFDASEDDRDGDPYALSGDGTATIPVTGALVRSVPRIFRAFGIEATGYDEITGAIAAANADPRVSRITLAVDSPGGMTSGVHGAADSIYESKKPVQAHISTLGASAGYWLASQARAGVTAARGAQVGSIGTYTVAVDTSARAEAAGVKVHLIASGDYKGAGTPGTPVTAAHLAEARARIDAITTEFISDIARGRGQSAAAVRDSADGRVYNVTDAHARGLIDRVTSDPEAERKMADTVKLFAALVREFPAHAALVAESIEAGKDEAAVRSDLRAKDQAAEVAKLGADLLAAAGRIAVLEAEKAELVLTKDAATAAHAALLAVANGAADASKIKADKESSAGAPLAQDEIDALSPLAKAKYFHSLGTAVAKPK